MGLMSKARFLLDRMKRFHRPFLRLVLVAVALFVIVPQMASVDSDGDGVPDLPAIASGVTPIAVRSSSTRKDSGPQEIHSTPAPALVATQPRHPEADKSDCAAHDGRSTLQSSCTLRC